MACVPRIASLLLLLICCEAQMVEGTAPPYSSLGCYGDKGSDRALPNYYRYIAGVDRCYAMAVNLGYKVFGVQYGGECWLDDSGKNAYARYGPSTACLADGTGGIWSNNVYEIKYYCSPNPCQNYGKCMYTKSGYSCDCPAGVKGTHCQEKAKNHWGGWSPYGPCTATCGGGVHLRTRMCKIYAVPETPGGAGCTGSCYASRECSSAPCPVSDPCSPNPCNNGTICSSTGRGFKCTCAPGLNGTPCRRRDHCLLSPCQNGGTCTDIGVGFKCACTNGFGGNTCEQQPKDCAAVMKSGVSKSGTYSINPDGKGSMEVYCDMDTDGGGWTVIQRRVDNSTDFYRNWTSYKRGFGSPSRNVWLGNDNIHRLTTSGNTVLRVDLEDWEGYKPYAIYGTFVVADESKKYKLTVGSYSGTAGDSLSWHNGMYFTTKDRDNDRQDTFNCAREYTGAWWYFACGFANLNGQYLGNTESYQGIDWYYWKRNLLSVKSSEMKVRPSSLNL